MSTIDDAEVLEALARDAIAQADAHRREGAALSGVQAEGCERQASSLRRSAVAIRALVSGVPRAGLSHDLYIHAHHALRALSGSAERHPEE